jgi:signal transduction histidine kinase/ActR/RegA family two-component response regulator
MLFRAVAAAAKSLAAPFRRTPRRSWFALAAVLVAVGTGVSYLVAAAEAHHAAESSRATLRTSAQAATSQLQLAIVHELDLDYAAGAFIAQNPNATQAQFAAWTRAMQVRRRYPEMLGFGFEADVPASQLVQFERKFTSQLPAGRGITPGPASIIPAGPRPFYCLTKVGLGYAGGLSLPPTLDACEFEPYLSATRASGAGAAASIAIIPSDAIFALGNPVYRGGGVPRTAAARRSAFLGWTAIAILPDVLLTQAQNGHPGITLTLQRGTGTEAARFAVRAAPPAASTIQVNLHDGWTLYVAGRVISGNVFADGSSLRILVVGVILTLLLAMLFFVLGTGRQRALRLVAEKTRELAAEVELTASARDAAVEASTAKSAFVATVSHELRTPLAGVIGTADLLLDTRLDDEQQEFAETLRSSGEALLLVINDILDYSKMESGKLELYTTDFSLRELVGECCARVLTTAKQKGITLTSEVDPNLPAWLHGDAGRIGQVLTNLLSNAIKFTEHGGVKITTSAHLDGPQATVRIEVADTGIGIDRVTLDKLFAPFVQADASTSRRYGGTGLGLAISAELVSLMGGQIGSESEPGHGSTFWFELTLPIADGATLAIKAPEQFAALGERDEHGNLTDAAPIVLIAEDNPINQMLAARMLDKCGFRSEVVSGGAEALAAVAENAYAAVLMDCQMPGIDGYEATREIRRRENGTGHIPIIAVTAHSLAGDREKCIAAGMDDYVSKPLRAGELRRTLERAVAGAARVSAR